jgi:hypothetical protein
MGANEQATERKQDEVGLTDRDRDERYRVPAPPK